MYEVFPNPAIALLWHSIYQTFGILQKNEVEAPFFFHSLFLNLIESLFQVVQNVVDMFCTDTQADGCRSDMLFGQLLRRKL